jgi:flagellar FliJ protein
MLNLERGRPITPFVVMPRFRFTLEAVRELREQAETSAKEALARELQLAAHTDEQLADASAKVVEARGALVLVPSEPVAAAALKARQDYLARRELERSVAELNAQNQAERVTAGRKSLELAARERAAVERMKERRLREHNQAVDRAEVRMLDDLGVRRSSSHPPAAA